MAHNPINLALRFLLELFGLFALGYWGWTRDIGFWRFGLAILAPVVGAAVWVVFRVPNDGGPPVVQIPGVVRLGIEVVYFGAATWGLAAAGLVSLAWGFGIVVLLHYISSYDRLIWLVKQ